MPVPNLALWEEVEKTDPKFTKEYTGPGGFTGTAVNAQYLAKRATEKFGPCGTGWGYDVIEERFDIGGPLLQERRGAGPCPGTHPQGRPVVPGRRR
ncbi:hypothetical protein M5G25_15895 [Pseudomonas sp. TNT2022 ID357]|uniref:Uncharacterized protein n=1 Tax=Pseudomonas idahonensis TaxID=2942628 RepID=A0ABT5Q6D8_9PSED|nr:hypothetical protein [Pseudomonas idahonensis]MDD1149777.1 hypothetical protein [Pseudomonas idahonensis]